MAVDNYQCMNLPSDYGQPAGPFTRRRLMPGELRVAAELQVLERDPPAYGAAIAASTRGEHYRSMRVRALLVEHMQQMHPVGNRRYLTLAVLHFALGTVLFSCRSAACLLL